MIKRLLSLAIVLIVLCYNANVLAKEVALTIDDLPFVGNAAGNEGKLRRQNNRFKEVLAVLKQEDVPAAGFVVPGSIEPGQWQLLQEFKNDGNLIANHTYTHRSLNRISADAYIADIKKADDKLEPLMKGGPKYFRYPFLASGRDCASYLKVKHYLREHDYQIVPVTIDTKDFSLNQRLHSVPWRQRRARLGYFRDTYMNTIRQKIRQAEATALKIEGRPVKQIVLIHMNTLNAYFLRDLIQLFRSQGYTFVSLAEAMQDPYYKHFAVRCAVAEE